ncbi:MAG: 23S rRNA (adenine(2503)-C(2))-methyltransferase RlmN [Bacteroidaceae bacterium]|nr:23S rRNA (adenine(2503)-C(2))-methyltransferase RlmN [Bacteroidaceae bacterium]
MKQPLLGLTIAELQEITLQLGMPKFTAKQIAEWIYGKHARSIDEMTNISKKYREMLNESYTIGCSEPVEAMRSIDGTVKFLFQTLEGNFIETVYIPDGDRATLCVSCQVGCKMNCLFCQTGKQGFAAQLTTTDILNQIYSVEKWDTLTNVVYMGQGEPFDNLDNVMKSLEILTADYGWAWSPKRITVSTVGLKKNLRRYLDESECHLAVSLHSPIHEQRLQLMPAEKQFAIADIVDLLKEYDWSHQRRITFEYILFGGINDTPLHSKELAKLLKGLDCRVNLIRWHKIPGVELNEVEESQMINFRDYLNNHGITCTIRASRGQDIYAACGLLSTKKQMENK